MMKTYVICLSKTFMKPHKRAGEPTHFAEKFRKTKLHTIRINHGLWCKRFFEIFKGEACLSVRQWEGKPYRSKQIELAKLTKDDGIGIQILEIDAAYLQPFYTRVNGKVINPETIAANDGLSFEDWKQWFYKEGAILSARLAIIHFTPFRYGNDNN